MRAHLQPVPDASQPPPSGAPGPEATHAWAVALRRGDVAAWSALYQAEYAAIFGQVRYLTGDVNVAEELAQETFAQAMASCGRFDPRRRAGAWLNGIAVNVVRKYWRKTKTKARARQRLEVMAQFRAPGDDPDRGHLRRERSRALYAALEHLPERWREAFVLRELQGLSPEEAAERAGVTTANLHVRVTRARARLREILTAQGWVDPPSEGAP
jgi:RNA polymerase sigma-70 factor (ECF subfamily)